MKDQQPFDRVIHLFRRAAMGSFPKENISVDEAVNQLFKDSESFVPLSFSSIPSIMERDDSPMKNTQNDKPKQLERQAGRKQVLDLNIAWVDLMVNSNAILRERMSLFWHGHFACRIIKPVPALNYINTIRRHALGSFRELLMAVCKEPAMLQYLNNQQNRKNNPNENFAREVMELFTMGRGNYSENDVKEGARAFTGWTFDNNGEFLLKERNHDAGVKHFLGQEGTFNGADVVRILLEKRETAHFITTKIYRSFVNDVPNKERIDKLAEDFYKSGYDISQLLRKIFTAEWFYDLSPQNALIKSPVELFTGIPRSLGGAFKNPRSALFAQKILGQMLFNPPNVAGWPGGRNWIDSSSLLLRMQLPEMMLSGVESRQREKDSGDDNDPFNVKRDRNLKLDINWKKWASYFEAIPEERLPEAIALRLLSRFPGKDVLVIVSKRSQSGGDRVEHVRTITQQVMSLPEYQVV